MPSREAMRAANQILSYRRGVRWFKEILGLRGREPVPGKWLAAWHAREIATIVDRAIDEARAGWGR